MIQKKSHIWGSHLKNQPDGKNVLFCAGRDVKELPMADEVLLPYDIWTNRAHCIMLERQGLMPKESLSKILTGLRQLEKLIETGEFSLDPTKEDVHINVEAFIAEKQGEDAGGRMHIGRSRNDQSNCDMRLYLRSAGLTLFDSVKSLAASILSQAEEHTESVMPGFTHYQPAMITTWGHWLCAYVQGLCRDLERISFSISQINRNPLGAAASFGTSWPIDRKLTAELLAFEKVDSNTLDCIVSRWENESQLAHTGAMLMNHLSIISQDLIFLSHPYTEFLQIDDNYVTGSSIMPQKKNPDFAEVIKSKASLAHGFLSGLLGVQKGGLSGYNRDTQVTKYLVMDLIRECEEAPLILRGVFESLIINTVKMNEKCETGFLNSVDIADQLARNMELPFRECYHMLSRAVTLSEPETKITSSALQKTLIEFGHPTEIALDLEQFNNPRKLVEQRHHQGSPSPEQTSLQIEELSEQLKLLSAPIEDLQKHVLNKHEECRNYAV